MAFVGDSAEQFAEQIQFMNANPDEVRRRSLIALDFIEASHSVEAVKATLATVLPELM